MKAEARKITADCQPVFPCWLWPKQDDVVPSPWEHWMRPPYPEVKNLMTRFTHYHPDQPTAPTMNPTEQGEGAFQEARNELRTIAQQVESERSLKPPRPCLSDEQVAQRAPAVCEDTRMLDWLQHELPFTVVTPIMDAYKIARPEGNDSVRSAIRAAMAQGEWK